MDLPERLPRTIVALAITAAIAACSAPQPPVASKEAAPVAKADRSRAPDMKPVPMPYEEPTVGGVKLRAGDTILASIARSPEHRILARAVDLAGLDEVLGGPGPLTFFAPTDRAFRQMPGGYERLLEPGNRNALATLLSFHLVPERLDDQVLGARVIAGNGSATLRTVSGGTLKATVGNGAALILDGRGGQARITVPNVLQGNGVMQVIDAVLSPPPAAGAPAGGS